MIVGVRDTNGDGKRGAVADVGANPSSPRLAGLEQIRLVQPRADLRAAIGRVALDAPRDFLTVNRVLGGEETTDIHDDRSFIRVRREAEAQHDPEDTRRLAQSLTDHNTIPEAGCAESNVGHHGRRPVRAARTVEARSRSPRERQYGLVDPDYFTDHARVGLYALGQIAIICPDAWELRGAM